MPSADFCCTVQEESLLLQSCFHDMQQTSRGKFDRLQRTTAGLTFARLDGYRLRCSSPTRPRAQASYPVLVHRPTLLLHASFRPRLATMPLRFPNPSPPSGWIRDLSFHCIRNFMSLISSSEDPADCYAQCALKYRAFESFPWRRRSHLS
jgi:hypothetical protein